jgi:hypothetical protein
VKFDESNLIRDIYIWKKNLFFSNIFINFYLIILSKL